MLTIQGNLRSFLFLTFLLLNLETWNLECICKIEIPWHFIPVKFLIFGLEIGLRPKNNAQRRPDGP